MDMPEETIIEEEEQEEVEEVDEWDIYRRSVVRAHFAGHGVPRGSTYKREHDWYVEGDLE